MGGYFKLFVLAATQVKSTNTSLASPWPRQMTTLGTSCTAAQPPAHFLHNLCKPTWTTWLHCKALLHFEKDGVLYVAAACAECYFKAVRPNLASSLMAAFPSRARCRVSRHLFKSPNFRPLLPSAAFLVTVEYCQRQNGPWFDCTYELAHRQASNRGCN